MKCIGDVMCAFSSVQDGRAKAGVAILLSEKFGAFLKVWKCVNE